MCLEKIQKANDLMGFNDSSPGEQGGGADKVSLAYHASLQPPHREWRRVLVPGAMAFRIWPGQWRWGCPPWGRPALSGRGCSGWAEVAASLILRGPASGLGRGGQRAA